MYRSLINKLLGSWYLQNKNLDINVLVSVCLSGVFLGMSKNEDDINKAIFYMPLITYVYSYVIVKNPILLLIYILCFQCSKKISDKSR